MASVSPHAWAVMDGGGGAIPSNCASESRLFAQTRVRKSLGQAGLLTGGHGWTNAELLMQGRQTRPV